MSASINDSNDLYIYKVAIDSLRIQLEHINNKHNAAMTTWNDERNKWRNVQNQQEQVITTLAEQLKKMDNESQVNSEKSKYELELKHTKKRLQEQIKMNNKLKKRIKNMKQFLSSCNNTLDDVICGADTLLEDETHDF